MSCKKLKWKAEAEQDRWLSYLPTKDAPNARYAAVIRRLPTQQERLDFLRYDSRGGSIPKDNIILAGKVASCVADYQKGRSGKRGSSGGWFPESEELFECYFEPNGRGWPGGLAVLEDYLRRVCGIKPLIRVFGYEAVHHWLSAFLYHAFGFPHIKQTRDPATKRLTD